MYNATIAMFGHFLDVAARRPAGERGGELRDADRPLQPARQADGGARPGGIVMVSSNGGIAGSINFGTYGAGKAFEWILAETLWAELGDHGVDVTTVMVGPTYSPNYAAFQATLDPAPGREPRVRRPARSRPGPPARPVHTGGGRRRVLRRARRRAGVLLASRRRVHLPRHVGPAARRGRRHLAWRPGNRHPHPRPHRPLTPPHQTGVNKTAYNPLG